MRAIRRLISQGALRRAGAVAGIVALSVTATLFAQRLTAAPTTTAQGRTGVIQATEFDLVAPDGTMLAQLHRGPEGNGNLTLYNPSSGTKRADINGFPEIQIYDSDGQTVRLSAGLRQDGSYNFRVNDASGNLITTLP